MKKALLPALLLLATSAHAADGYLGLGIGVSTVDGMSAQDFAAALDDGSFVAAGTDDTDTAFKLFAGVQLTPNLAIEAAYTRLGTYTAQATSDGSGFFYAAGSVNYEAEGSAVSVALKGIAPLNDTVSLYGKLGMARWDVEETLSNNGFPVLSVSDDGTDPYLALGVAFRLSDQLSLQVEVERFVDVLEEDVGIMGAALQFRF